VTVLKPTRIQRALFEEQLVLREDGELNFCVEDHLNRIATANRAGLSDCDLAKGLGVSVNYIQSLKATMPGQKKK
jgi:ribosome-binding protein aMBF1 (putative translation factor)